MKRVRPDLKKEKKKSSLSIETVFGFICAHVSSVDTWYNLSCLLQTYGHLSTSEACDVTCCDSGWRKDAVKQCSEFAPTYLSDLLTAYTTYTTPSGQPSLFFCRHG